MNLSKNYQAIKQLSSSARSPLIKFIGNHGTVPRYDPNATAISGSRPSHGSHVLIDEMELPSRYQRRMPSPEEIAVINSGGLRLQEI